MEAAYNEAKRTLKDEHTLDAWVGSRTVGQLNNRTSHSSSQECEGCKEIRRFLIDTIIRKSSMTWLVKVEDLRVAAEAKGPKQCGFCRRIHEQFWEHQRPRFRLVSLLWARQVSQIVPAGVSETDPDEAGELFTRIWNEVGAMPRACFQETLNMPVSQAVDCPKSDCRICGRGGAGKAALLSLEDLCEPCRVVTCKDSDRDASNIVLDPILLLGLLPTIHSDGGAFSSLKIRHVSRIPVNFGTRKDWGWKMYTFPSDKAASYVPAFHRASYDSPGVYEQVKAWMTACQRHQHCQSRRRRSTSLPTRVLALTEDGCRLLETTGEVGEYVALSYRWGADQPHKLTTKTLADHKKHIDTSSLPLVIQEAVAFTRKLGFKYLWIDAMTILQDDEPDKSKEIARMCDVYGQSSLTICASGSRSCNEGFFDGACMPGGISRLPDIGVNYPCDLPDGSVGHVRLVEFAEYRPEEETLASRAWAYQEEMLPVAIVQLGACLTWDCVQVCERRTVTSLTGGIDAGIPFRELFFRDKEVVHTMRTLIHQLQADPNTNISPTASGGPIDRSGCPASKRPTRASWNVGSVIQDFKDCICPDGPFFAAWQFAVLKFSQRELTDPADRLPAIAGLVEAFARTHKDEYIAGLWRRRLIHDLMWKSGRPPKAVIQSDQADNRRHAWRAPSWAWSCLDGEIEIVGPHNRLVSKDGNLVPGEVLAQREVARVVKCEVGLLDSGNTSGHVKGGTLELLAPMIKARLVRGNEPGKLLDSLQIPGVRLPLAYSPSSILHPDDFAVPDFDLRMVNNPDLAGCATDEHGSIDIYCLQMREEILYPTAGFRERLKADRATLMDGLMLLPVQDRPGAYRRVGVWNTEYNVVTDPDQNPFKDAKPSLVTII